MDMGLFDEVLGEQENKLPRRALKSLAEAGRWVDNVAGAPMEKALDLYTNYNPYARLSKNVASAAANAVGQTEPAQKAMEWFSNHPNTASLGADALQATSLIPMGHMFRHGLKTPFKETLNTASQNLKTRLDGFYTGDPLGAMYRNFSPEDTFKDMFNPQARANFRATTGANRRKEFIENVNNKQTGHAVGNMRASADIKRQAGKSTEAGNLLDDMPMSTGTSLGIVRANDRNKIKQLSLSALPEGHKAPDYVVDFMVDKPINDMGSRHGKELLIARAMQLGGKVPDPDRAMVSVVDNKAPNTELPWETTGGGAVGGAAAKATSSKPVLKNAEQLMGSSDNWTPEQWADFYKVAGAFERDKWYGTAALQANLPDNKFTRYVTQKVVGKDRSPGIRDVFGKKTKPMKALARYWNLKSNIQKYDLTGKGTKPTEAQRNIVAAVDKIKERTKVNLMTNPDGSVKALSYQGSFLSKDQDLGGVGYRLVHDFENKNIYSNGFDGHDLMGADPVGGDQFYNLTPIMVKKPGEKLPITRRSKIETEDRASVQLKNLEQKTGIPRGPKESAQAYQARVMQDYNAPITLSDYMQPARAMSLAIDLESEEEQ